MNASDQERTVKWKYFYSVDEEYNSQADTLLYL